MNTSAELPTLLRGEAEPLQHSIRHCSGAQMMVYLAVILIGAGLFGLAVGYWRSPLQACYTGLKFPLILLLTALGNGLINGMLAPLLGLNISFRQSMVAVLMSFTIAAAILGAFSPILFLLVWNTPQNASGQLVNSYSLILLTQVLVIAFAGLAANLRLLQLLQGLSRSRAVAIKILCAWLAINLLLGAQLSWNLRPFVGSPGLPVQFLRPDAFRGNFFEAVSFAARTFISTENTNKTKVTP